VDPVIGRLTLVIYAALLGTGGVMGYLKAGSRPSLIAGLLSAAFALLCFGETLLDLRLGFWPGAALAASLLGMFGARFAKGRKFMPNGLMAIVSAVVLAVLVAQIALTPLPTAGIAGPL